MNKKLYLHIGQYKTGSTSLQEFLAANREALLGKGILYPSSLLRDSAHFPLDDLLRSEYRGKDGHSGLADLFTELTIHKHELLVLSCEAFSGDLDAFHPERTMYVWKRLGEIFSDYLIIPVVYIRRQDDAIESRIIELIKGRARSAEINVELFLSDKSALNYYYFLSSLTEVYGKNSVILRVYNRKLLINGDIAVDFIVNCSIETAGLAFTDKIHNPTPSGRYLEFVRYLNQSVLPKETEVILRNLAWRIYHEREFLGDAKVLDHAMRRKIMDYYFESNVKLLETFGDVSIGTYAREFFGDSRNSDPNCKLTGTDVFDVLLAYVSGNQNANSQSGNNM